MIVMVRVKKGELQVYYNLITYYINIKSKLRKQAAEKAVRDMKVLQLGEWMMAEIPDACAKVLFYLSKVKMSYRGVPELLKKYVNNEVDEDGLVERLGAYVAAASV